MQESLNQPANSWDNLPPRSRRVRLLHGHGGSIQQSEYTPSSTTADEALLSSTKALSTSLPDVLQLPLERERKIRNVDIVMFWFVSRGPQPIKEPLRSGVRFTDLYLHLYEESEVQIWIWNRDNVWESVEQGYVHPRLPDRRLWLPSRDEPSWITRKTARTYKGKQVKGHGP